jgi:hypothetical protein
MQLRIARLCLDCEEVHDEGQCPVCASETFTFLSRWVPSDERRRRPRIEIPAAPDSGPETAPTERPDRARAEFDAYRRLSTGDLPQARGRALLKKGMVGLAAVGVVGWLWGRKGPHESKPRKTQS